MLRRFMQLLMQKEKLKKKASPKIHLSRYGPLEQYSSDIIEIIPVSSKRDTNKTDLKNEQHDETSKKETKVKKVEKPIVIEILDSPEKVDKKEKDLSQAETSIQRPAKRTRNDDLDTSLKLRKIENGIDTKAVNKGSSKIKAISATPSKLGSRPHLRSMDVVDSPKDEDDDEVYVDTVEQLDISPKKLVFDADNPDESKDQKIVADPVDNVADHVDNAETTSLEKRQEEAVETPAAPPTRRRSRRGSKGGLMELDHDGKLKKQVDLRAERLRRMSVNSDEGGLNEVLSYDKDVKDEVGEILDEATHNEETEMGERETRSSLRKAKAGTNSKKRR
ncbi:unnamed protein product [[Candida] boidinii]|uniref:Unnamed protein product n=1 Tax=Candida boidinii TaxID=5477 RepID=A0ACB5TQK0_CANBO|nr:unnamed protein product [[Candida] boidinii]